MSEDEIRAARLRRDGMIEVNSPFDPSDPTAPHLGSCKCDGCLLAKLDAAANGTYNYSERDQLYSRAHGRITSLLKRVATFEAYLKESRESLDISEVPEEVLMQLTAKVLVPEIMRLRSISNAESSASKGRGDEDRNSDSAPQSKASES